MPKPPNMQNLLAQAQKMQEEMMAAQERLKDKTVEASAGGGGQGRDERRARAGVADDRPGRRRSRGRRDAPGPRLGRDQRGDARRDGAAEPRRGAGRQLRSAAALDMLGGMGGLGGLGGGPTAAAAAQASRGSASPRPLQRLVTELAKLPASGSARRSGSRFTSCAPTRGRIALADAIREVKEKIGLCEICFNLAEGPRCTICLDERREPRILCVVGSPAT